MKWDYKLWFRFALNVIGIFMAVFLLIGAICFAFLHPTLPEKAPSAWISIASLLAAGFFAATALTLWVSKHLFQPIEQLSDALIQVASGDFHICLPEDGSSPQIHQMNHNFNKMAKELNSVEMLRSDFIQNVSHEIKTPLAAIEGYALFLKGSPLSEEQQVCVKKIIENSSRLSFLTGNVLHLSQLEKQYIVSEKESFSLDEQLREAILSLEPLWNKKKLEIDIDLPPVNYYGNPSLIYQIWTNLFSNAIKFTPEHGSIHAEIDKKGNGISVTICDTGIGMTEEVQKHIFEKFYQGEKSRHIEGNGLGLSLVKKIVELCGGTICVESEPDCGSAFSVWLPLENRA